MREGTGRGGREGDGDGVRGTGMVGGCDSEGGARRV